MKLKSFPGAVLFFAVLGLCFGPFSQSASGDDIICELDDFIEGDLIVDGFELKTQTTLNIYAIGAELRSSDAMYAYGWILDADTREEVWVLSEEDTRRFNGSRILREYEDEVTLPAGRYEVYYFVSDTYYLGNKIIIDDLRDALEILDYVFDGDDDDEDYIYKEYPVEIEELVIRIEAPEGSFTKFNPVTELEKNAIINFSRPDDDFIEKKGFKLTRDLTLKITAIGEYSSSDRVFVDYGWIIDADSRKKVWQMDKWNTSWAGGGRKNRAFVDEIELPAGNYIAGYATDDSHSFNDWNVPPPYDPLHYGLMVYLTDDDDQKYVEDYEDTYMKQAVISLTRIRDDRFVQKGFSLDGETDLHIVALGEYGYSDEFVDYGWIENLASGDIVWEMNEDNTEHAGGAKKNRKFDGVVTLPKGDYMVYYVTDDSHSYRRWNASAPIEREMWGITLYGVGDKFNPESIEVFDDIPKSSNILVRLTGIGDDEDIRESFELDKPQKIHIYALGEGSSGSMYDYAYIENADEDDIIWEMTYRKTRHAGGARKNREVDTEIYLEPGRYYVYFVTDGSHSFPDFNASRPDNPQKWGVTVTAVD